jgi:hypothetical protein
LTDKQEYIPWIKVKLELGIIVSIFLLLLVTSVECNIFQNTNAVGTWAGRNTIFVPISWCTVRGSPAFENPNIPNSNGGIDNSTDQVLLKRGERVTDYIYINQTGIGFRSAINNALHTSLHFPNITDPEAVGPPGNLTVTHHGREFNSMLNECKSAWTNMTINNTGSVDGLFAINVRLFFDDITGQETDTTGIGYCHRNSTGYCGIPYDGHLTVVDNYFMIPGVASGKYNDDPFDEALGHELGHALSLQHRNWDTNALMNTNQQHNGPGGTVSNIGITGDEVASLRNSTSAIPGIEFDPENRIVLGNAVQSIAVDKIRENKTLSPFEDISSVEVSLDKKHNIVAFGQDLFGLIPEKIKNNTKYWTLVNLDDIKKTGATKTILDKIGVPPTKFSGADLVILSQANSSNSTGRVWTIKNNTASLLPGNLFKPALQTVMVHLDTPGTQPYLKSSDNEIPLYNSINVILNNTNSLVKLNKAFSIQAIVTSNGTTVDRLDDEISDKGKILELKQPSFPRCFLNDNAIKGNSINISASGLAPNSDIHAFLGPILVGNGTTSGSGNGTITFTIPNEIASGLHLMTVELNNTALAANCVIDVHDQNQRVISK